LEGQLDALKVSSQDAASKAENTIGDQLSTMAQLETAVEQLEANGAAKDATIGSQEAANNDAMGQISQHLKELAQLHEKVAELETIESGLQRELENSQGLLRIERKESEGVQDQMMSELDKRTKELGDSQEQFQTAQHGWMADKQQLENHLEGSKSEVAQLNQLSTQQAAQQVSTDQELCESRDELTKMEQEKQLQESLHQRQQEQQDREMAACKQEFEDELQNLKSQIAEVKLQHSDTCAHLETSEHMYAEAQADLTHLNDKYKRAKHLLSQRHWRGAGNAIFGFFRNAAGAHKMRCFQSWKAVLLHKEIAGFKERERDHVQTIMDEAAKRAKLKKQALNVQKQNQTIRTEQALLTVQDQQHQVAAGKALIRTSVKEIESFFTKVGTFFLEENAKSYKQYKAENPDK